MLKYEYKVVPAPSKGQKAKGVKTPEGKFALSVESALNQLAAEGWEYLRAELLPSDERVGLTGSAVHWRNVLVFRRAVAAAAAIAPVTADTDATETGAAETGVAETGVAETDAAQSDATESASSSPATPGLVAGSAFRPVVRPAVDPVVQPAVQPVVEPVVEPAVKPAAATRMATGAERMLKDNGVEEISEVFGITAALRARAEQNKARNAASDEAAKEDKSGNEDKDVVKDKSEDTAEKEKS